MGIQTLKKFYHRSYETQISGRTRPNSSQTIFSVETIRDLLIQYFPKSSLLLMNLDQFSRILTGNERIPFLPESIIQAVRLQSAAGSSAYNLFRTEFPNLLPCPSLIRLRLNGFKNSHGPIICLIELLCHKLSFF